MGARRVCGKACVLEWNGVADGIVKGVSIKNTWEREELQEVNDR